MISILKFLRDHLVNWPTFIGQGGPRFLLSYSPMQMAPEYAIMLINATSQKIIIDQLMPKMEAFLLLNFSDVILKIRPIKLGPPMDVPVEIRISGKDMDTIFGLVEKVKEKLASIPGTKNIKDNWEQRTKKLLVQINQPRARRAGVTSRDVVISLQTVLTGLETTQYREEDEVIPIVLRTVADERLDIGKLESHKIYAQQTGRSVPFKNLLCD